MTVLICDIQGKSKCSCTEVYREAQFVPGRDQTPRNSSEGARIAVVK